MEVILAGGFGHNVEVILGEADELTRAAATMFEVVRQNGGISSIATLLCEYVFVRLCVCVCVCVCVCAVVL